MFKKFGFIVIMILPGLSVKAQNFLSWKYYDRYFSVFAGTGQAMYFGELNSTNRVQREFSHVSLGSEVRLWKKVGARIETSYYRIYGDDKFAQAGSFERQRNLSFDARNFEANLLGVFFLKSYPHNFHVRWRMDPFITFGAGITSNNPTTVFNGERIKLRDIQTEDVSYAGWVATIPLSIGTKFRITEFMNLNLELVFRYTFTDYLDDVSGVYPAIDEVKYPISNRKNELGRIINQEAYNSMEPGGLRGNPANNDHYLFLSYRLEFFLPKGKGPFLKKPNAF